MDWARELEENEESVEDDEDELNPNKSEMFPSLLDPGIPMDATSNVLLGNSAECESSSPAEGDRWVVFGLGGRGGGVLPGFILS